MTCKWYGILHHPKMHPHTNCGIPTSSYLRDRLYTILPHNLIKEKLTELIEQTFNREGSLYLACNDNNAFFTS